MKKVMEKNGKIILSLLNKFKLLQLTEFLLVFILGIISIGGLLALILWISSPLLNFSRLGLSSIIALVNALVLVLTTIVFIYKLSGLIKAQYIINMLHISTLIICLLISLGCSIFSFINNSLSIYFLFILMFFLLIASFGDNLISLFMGFSSAVSAVRLEDRAGFKGEVVSAVDFLLVKGKYSHNQELESLFINKLNNKLKNINPFKYFKLTKPFIRVILSILPLAILLSGQLLFSYKPSDAVNDAFRKETLPELEYDLYYTHQVLYGEEFFVLIRTNADLTTLTTNYNSKEIMSVPKEYKGNIAKIMNRSTKTIHKEDVSPVFDEKANHKTNNITNKKYYLYSMDKIIKDFTFNITFSLYNNKETIPKQNVDIVFLPEIESIEYTLRYPKVYKLNDYTSKGDGNIRTFAESSIHLKIRSNKRLTSAVFVLSDGQSEETHHPMTITQHNPIEAQLNYTITKKGSYYISLTDNKGYTNTERKITYAIDIIEDNPPTIELLEPKSDISVEQLNRIALGIHSQDDIEVSSLYIKYSVNNDGKQKKVGTIPLSIEPNRLINYNSVVNFTRSGAERGDRIEFHVRAFDSKGQSAESESVSIIYLDEYDVLDSIEITQGEEEQRLKDLLEEQKRLKEELETMMSNPAVNKEARTKELKELIESEKKLIKEINKTKENLKKMKELSKKENDKELSPELNKKIEEINKLLDELNREKAIKTVKQLEEMMKNPQESYQNRNSDKQPDEEEYIKKLEKAIEKLKTLKDLNTLAKAQKLAKQSLEQQQAINNDIKTDGKSDKRKLDKLSELTQKLESTLGEVKGKQIEQQTKMTKENIETLNEEALPSFSNLARKKEKQFSSLIKGAVLETRINEAVNDLEAILKKASGQHITDFMGFLDRLIVELISLNENINGLNDNIVKYKNQIDNVKQELISKLIEEILFIRGIFESRRSTFDKSAEGILPTENKKAYLHYFEEIAINLEGLAEAFNEKRMFSTSRMMNATISELNILTMELIKLKAQIKKQMQNSQGQGGGNPSPTTQNQSEGKQSQGNIGNDGSNDLDALADAQQRLTKETEDFIGKNKDGELSKEEQKYLENLGEEQDAIGDRLNNVVKDGLSKEKESIKQDIEQLRKEMNEIAEELKAKNIDYNILDRQKQVIKRMFETKDEIDNIEYKKERQAQIALENILNEGNQEELEKELKKQLSRQNLQNLSISEDLDPEYVQYIKDYFKRLND